MMQKVFSKTAKGVDVRLTGEVRRTALEAMASECSAGECSCACDSGIKERITAIGVSGEDGDVVLSLEGKGLEPDRVAEAMEQCNMDVNR